MEQTPATEIYNSNVYNLIPIDARKILEVGTGSGSLAAAIKKRNSNVDYVGVEVTQEYVELSRPRCDRVYLENFEKPSYKIIKEIQDKEYIIFCDVLEHFVDPWSVLEMLNATMHPDGKIIASIPNIQHWSIQMRLNWGDWRYADSGLLDKTHVRFFTRETIIELFNQTGFEVIHMEPRIFNFPNQDQALKVVTQITELLGGNVSQSKQDALTWQFVVIAKPK